MVLQGPLGPLPSTTTSPDVLKVVTIPLWDAVGHGDLLIPGPVMCVKFTPSCRGEIRTWLLASMVMLAHSPAAAGLAGSGVVVAGAATWVVAGAGAAWTGSAAGAQADKNRGATARTAAKNSFFMRYSI